MTGTVLDEIRGRRKATLEQALMMLELVPASDTDTRYSLLSTAARYLYDAGIAAKWMELIAAESDTHLKSLMLGELMRLDFRQLSEKELLFNLLRNNLQQDETREVTISLLGRLGVENSEAREVLINFYKTQENADTGRLVLSWLLINSDIPEEETTFFTEILETVDTDYKLAILSRLLRTDWLKEEQFTKYLHPSEPEAIKRLVLGYCADRSIKLFTPLQTLIAADTSVSIRHMAVQSLTTQGIGSQEMLETLLGALLHDPDSSVRQAAAHAFQYGISLTPETISVCCQSLQIEKDIGNAFLILNLLTPWLGTNEQLPGALLSLTSQFIQAPLAVAIYSAVGRLLPKRPDIFAFFLAAYEKEQRDDIKAAILHTIAAAPVQSAEMGTFYLQALQAPSPEIKTWGVHGILQLPLTRENTAIIESSAVALLEPHIDTGKKRLLAAKIACIPQKSASLIAVLKKVLDSGPDPRIGEICRTALEQAVTEQGSEQIDWGQWLHQADVEHQLTNIFPHIWIYYEDNPAMAGKILWSALTPANSNSLYQARVSEGKILTFLAARNDVQDDLSYFCINKLLNAKDAIGPDYYLLILKANPGFADLGKSLWLILEKYAQTANQLLLLELLEAVYGAGLVEVFENQLQQKNSAAGYQPYLRFLSVNVLWPFAGILLKQLAAVPLVSGDKDNCALLQEACKNAGIDIAEILQARPSGQAIGEDGPGFAD